MFKRSFEPLMENIKKLREIVSKEIHSFITKSQIDDIFIEIGKQVEDIQQHYDYLERMEDLDNRSSSFDD